MFILIIKYSIIFLYISLTISVSDCYTTKHNKYKEYTIEDYKLCSPVANREIDLKKEEAVIVTQTKTKDHSADWSKNLRCKFSIESKTGLFAVVQNLNLRVNQFTGECIDYIQFATKKVNHHEKLCGNYNVALNSVINPNFTAIDPYGYIETIIYIAKEKLSGETTDFKIVYTKYRDCDGPFESCFSYDYCIHEDLFNDTIVNCPVDDCLDEWGCENHRKKLNLSLESDSNSTKIILSAVTSLVISFVVFIICIWVCKKTGKLCFGAGCANTTRTGLPSRVIEMQNRSESAVAQPAVDVSPASPDPEKDLPPSYDSLFPSR